MGATLLEGFGVVRSNTAKMLSLVRLGWNSVGSTDTSTAGLRMSFERTFVCPSNYGTDDHHICNGCVLKSMNLMFISRLFIPTQITSIV